MDKKELRTYIRNKKRQFSDEQLRELSLPVICRLLSHPVIAEAKTILMYYSLPDEVYTHDAIMRLAADGKTVLLPRVISGTQMELHLFQDESDLTEGCYGILEPTGGLFKDYGKIDAVVIPGMSFDAHGNRLGRGKGYYDRFLPTIPNTYKIGVCFDFQKTENIPTDEHDIKMDEVI